MNSQISQNHSQDKSHSMWKLAFEQFLKHRMAVIGLITILVLCLTALSAKWITKWTGLDPDRQNVSARYLQPFEKAILSSDQREMSVEKWIQEHPAETSSLINEITSATLVSSTGEDCLYDLASKEPTDALALIEKLPESTAKTSFQKMLSSFERIHLFGTDELGRDVFIRLIYGARVSIGVGILVALASALIGFFIGSFAGYYGGVIDTLLMRVTDSLLSLPLVPVLIVIAAVDLQKLPWLYDLIGGPNESIFKMVIILCMFSWMTVALLVRGAILSLKEREFILAAKTLGAKDSTIILKHLFPNVMAPMLVSISLGVGESILFEAALSFLGLGIMPPTPSWGNMLNNAQEVIYKNIWLAVLPGVLILLTTMSFNFFGDGLQDAMDPKSRRR